VIYQTHFFKVWLETSTHEFHFAFVTWTDWTPSDGHCVSSVSSVSLLQFKAKKTVNELFFNLPIPKIAPRVRNMNTTVILSIFGRIFKHAKLHSKKKIKNSQTASPDAPDRVSRDHVTSAKQTATESYKERKSCKRTKNTHAYAFSPIIQAGIAA